MVLLHSVCIHIKVVHKRSSFKRDLPKLSQNFYQIFQILNYCNSSGHVIPDMESRYFKLLYSIVPHPYYSYKLQDCACVSVEGNVCYYLQQLCRTQCMNISMLTRPCLMSTDLAMLMAAATLPSSRPRL